MNASLSVTFLTCTIPFFLGLGFRQLFCLFHTAAFLVFVVAFAVSGAGNVHVGCFCLGLYVNGGCRRDDHECGSGDHNGQQVRHKFRFEFFHGKIPLFPVYIWLQICYSSNIRPNTRMERVPYKNVLQRIPGG